MGRNKKKRWVSGPPPASMFKPAGIPARDLERVVLRLDEYEALRLADYEGLKQEEVAAKLNVSRPTVSRILESARRTVASAMAEAKTLVVEGGPVQQRPAPGRGRGGRRRRRGRGGPPGK